MKKKNLFSFLTVILTIVMVGTLFAGCGSKGASNANQTLVYNLGTDSETIDPALNEAVDGATVIANAFEGLTRIGDDNNVKPGVAEKWEISADGTVYTFHLRKEAKWSDGKPVTAKDFEYAWKRALDPKLAATYVFFLTDNIKNAQEYYEGKAKWEDVGIKVKDDYTIEVTLKVPTAFFLQLLAMPIYMPLRQDAVEKGGEQWTQSGDTYIGNGPFKMVKWTHNDSMEWEKNENYWDAKNVKLSKMTWVMVNEASSALTSWEKGEIDVIETVPSAEVPRLTKENKLQIYPELGTYYLYFNTKKAPLDNPKVRKALTLAINRQAIIDAVLKTGQKPAYAQVPYGITESDGKSDFREKGGDLFKEDVQQAKQLLAEAGYPDGKGFPEMTYLYNTSEAHQKIAEMIQDMWKKNLGINIKLANQEWKVFQKTRQNGDFEIARGGWMADYVDPMTFIDMFMSDNGFNDGKFTNAQYDQLLKQAKSTTDLAKRDQLMHDAEKILMDEQAVCPIYFYVSNMCVKPWIKGVYKTPLATVYFDHAYVDESAKK
ncbi:peptide ABC transporter substrate-binding protein [Caloramator sp. E03]|uniref:peptide ABC transporter substrate-binding protein n=1 Tax=Caloramator sp. E03 TaxID=2576307 RepID=UPI001110C601|nr:peptide ABC transporter substrate-binding protein [Caloramator sp. E03]QCX33088.1 peptide ABC transporter substrate-binding protein [Caloramator sp. E03]